MEQAPRKVFRRQVLARRLAVFTSVALVASSWTLSPAGGAFSGILASFRSSLQSPRPTTTLDRSSRPSRLQRMAEKEEEDGHQTGHKVKNAGNFKEMDPEELELQQKLKEHQSQAPKLSGPVEVRSLVQYNHGFAVMSTHSASVEGFPSGSVVGFTVDDQGRPLFSFSSMSTHTQDLLKDKRCSLTIASKEFKGAADGRVNFIGEAVPIKGKEEQAAAREIYLKKHPKAFWIDFADFTWFRMEVQHIRFVGGFARAGFVSAEEYTSAKPDPIMAFGGHVAGHMNDDHRDSTMAMVQHYVGIDVQDAEITAMDSLGMYIKVSRTPKAADQMQQFKIRLPFIRPLENRKDAKTVIVEMTQASAGAAAKEKEKENA